MGRHNSKVRQIMKKQIDAMTVTPIRLHKRVDLIDFSAFTMRKRRKMEDDLRTTNILKTEVSNTILDMIQDGKLELALKEPTSLQQISTLIWKRLVQRIKTPHVTLDAIYFPVYKELQELVPHEEENESTKKLRLFSYVTYERCFGRTTRKFDSTSNIPEEEFPDIAPFIYYWEEEMAAAVLGNFTNSVYEDQLSSHFTLYTKLGKREILSFSTKWELLPNLEPTIKLKRKQSDPTSTIKSILKSSSQNTPSTPFSSLLLSLSPKTLTPHSEELDDTAEFTSQTKPLFEPEQTKPSMPVVVHYPSTVQKLTTPKPPAKKKRVAGF